MSLPPRPDDKAVARVAKGSQIPRCRDDGRRGGRGPPARISFLEPGANLDLLRLDTLLPSEKPISRLQGCKPATMICRIFYFETRCPAIAVYRQYNQEAGRGV
jgi:hypothetical protein